MIIFSFNGQKVISILEYTVENSRQREAILDEALASTDVSVARSHLQNTSVDDNIGPITGSSEKETKIADIEDQTEKKDKDDNDWYFDWKICSH